MAIDPVKPKNPRRTVPVLPLGGAPFSLQLVRSERGGDFEPFVRLGAKSADSRAYLAHLNSAAGVEMQPLVLRLPDLGRLDPGAPSCEMVDREWQERFESLEHFGNASTAFPPLVMPAGHGVEHHLPPMVYCPQRERLFRIPCPETLEPLTTCRAPELLVDPKGEQSLPLYSDSAVPLLHNPKAALFNPNTTTPREGTVFYVPLETVPEELAEKGVKGLADLRAELAENLDRREADGPPVDREDFPGIDEPWQIFTDRDMPFLVTPFYRFELDRFADFLGGRHIDGSTPRVGQGSEGYLFALEGSGLDAVEILLLKLTLFAQTLEALELYYENLDPHLDLRPGHLMVEANPGHGNLPARWGFQVKLLGLSAARPHTLPGGEMRVMMPPRHPETPYCSPKVREAALAERRQGELSIERFHPESEGSDRWLIQGRLRDPKGIWPLPEAGDYMTLEWSEVLPEYRDPVPAVCESGYGKRGSDLEVLIGPVVLDEKNRRRLEHNRGLSSPPGVYYRIHPRLGVPEDLYSLGVLLLRLLLVNDEQDANVLGPILAEIANGIVAPVEDALESGPVGPVLEAFGKHQDILSPRNIFFNREDREPNRPNAIPNELWLETLDLAWRLVGRVGFKLGADGSYQNDQPTVHLREVSVGVEHIIRQARLVLFRRQPMHYEIHALIAEMLATGIEER